MVDPRRPRGDDAVRLLIAAVCAVVLVVPVIVGDHVDAARAPALETSRAAPAAKPGTSAAQPPETGRKRPARRRGAPVATAEARRRAAALSATELAGQVLLVGFKGTDLRAGVFGELRRHGWGGIVITPANALTLDAIRTLSGEATVVSRDAGRVPPLVVAEPDGSPAQPSLGDRRPGAVRSRIRTAARRLRGIGVTLALDPVADIGSAAGPLADRMFSDDPAVVSALSRAAVNGWLAGGVLPAPGHFPGQGAATQDPLDGPASVGLDRDDLAERDLVPFRRTLPRAPAVVVSSAAFAAYAPVTPAALAPAITRDLLRRKLRFGGVAMTGDVAGLAAATGRSQAQAAVQALRAGIDLVYVPDASRRRRVHAAVVAAVRQRRLPVARVRQAAARVLQLKRRAQ